MTIEQILAAARGEPGVLELAPEDGSVHPEISWGDHFFYYAPDGVLPTNRQPYATIITKDYPDDAASQLSAPDRWRLNIHVGSAGFADVLGYPTDAIAADVDYAQTDVFLPHPLYGAYGWLSVVCPAAATTQRTLTLLHEAHLADQRRVDRRLS